MNQVVQIDFTLFRFAATIIIMSVTFGGLFIAVGRMLAKQKSNCKSIGKIKNAIWDKKGRPVLQSVAECKEEREELKGVCDQILNKLERMDAKRDKAIKHRDKQIEVISKHMTESDIRNENIKIFMMNSDAKYKGMYEEIGELKAANN